MGQLNAPIDLLIRGTVARDHGAEVNEFIDNLDMLGVDVDDRRRRRDEVG